MDGQRESSIGGGSCAVQTLVKLKKSANGMIEQCSSAVRFVLLVGTNN